MSKLREQITSAPATDTEAEVCVDCANPPAHVRTVPGDRVGLIGVPGTDLRVCFPHAEARDCAHGYRLADSCPVCP